MSADEEREGRITYDVVVDAYDEEERRLGWYYYLERSFEFPFPARTASGEEVTVIGLPPEEECEEEMFVTVKWEWDAISEPVAGMQAPNADRKTREAIEDWNYWLEQGYQF